MKIKTIVTLDDKDKYYLTAETVQNDIKYFLAVKLDENKKMTDTSCIFEQIIEGDDVYLQEVKDEKTANYIAAVFTANVISEIDEM